MIIFIKLLCVVLFLFIFLYIGTDGKNTIRQEFTVVKKIEKHEPTNPLNELKRECAGITLSIVSISAILCIFAGGWVILFGFSLIGLLLLSVGNFSYKMYRQSKKYPDYSFKKLLKSEIVFSE